MQVQKYWSDFYANNDSYIYKLFVKDLIYTVTDSDISVFPDLTSSLSLF